MEFWLCLVTLFILFILSYVILDNLCLFCIILICQIVCFVGNQTENTVSTKKKSSAFASSSACQCFPRTHASDTHQTHAHTATGKIRLAWRPWKILPEYDTSFLLYRRHNCCNVIDVNTPLNTPIYSVFSTTLEKRLMTSHLCLEKTI